MNYVMAYIVPVVERIMDLFEHLLYLLMVPYNTMYANSFTRIESLEHSRLKMISSNTTLAHICWNLVTRFTPLQTITPSHGRVFHVHCWNGKKALTNSELRISEFAYNRHVPNYLFAELTVIKGDLTRVYDLCTFMNMYHHSFVHFFKNTNVTVHDIFMYYNAINRCRSIDDYDRIELATVNAFTMYEYSFTDVMYENIRDKK